MRKGFDSFSIAMFRIAKFFLMFTIYIVVIFFVGKMIFNFGYKLFYESNMYDKTSISKTIDIIIDKNDSWDKIANELVKDGIIDDEKVFTFRAKIYKTKKTPGHYQFNTKQSIKNILDAIDEGEIMEVNVDAENKGNN